MERLAATVRRLQEGGTASPGTRRSSAASSSSLLAPEDGRPPARAAAATAAAAAGNSTVVQAAPSELSEGAQFRANQPAIINSALLLLVENTKRNIPHTAEVEAQQKMALSAALVRFLVAASGPADGAPPDAPPVWPTAVSMMQEHTATQSMLEVMRNEDRYGDPHATLWLEHTALGSQVASLLTSLPDLDYGPAQAEVLTGSPSC